MANLKGNEDAACWRAPAEFRGAAGGAFRDQPQEIDEISLSESGSFYKSGTSSRSSSGPSCSSLGEVETLVSAEHMYEGEEECHGQKLDDEQEGTSPEAALVMLECELQQTLAELPHATISSFVRPATSREDKQSHWRQVPQQEHSTASSARTAKERIGELSGCTLPEGLEMTKRANGACRRPFADCTRVDLGPQASEGVGLAACSASGGLLLLLAVNDGNLCLLHIASPDSPENLLKAGKQDLSKSACAGDCDRLLTLTGDLPFGQRLQGEAALVRIGDETLLLVSESQDLKRTRPACISVHALNSAGRDRSTQGEPTGGRRRPRCAAFEDLPSWPSGWADTSPEPRSFYGVAADETRRAVLLFGGASPDDACGLPGTQAHDTEGLASSPMWHPLDDLWSFSLDSCQWVKHEPCRDEAYLSPWPRPVAGHSMSTWGRNIWMFGGYTQPCWVSSEAQQEKQAVNDLWCLNLDGGMWRQIPSSGETPPPRYLHVTSICDGCLLLFGGLSATGPVPVEDTLYAADLTSLTTAIWSRVATALHGLPPSDYYLGAASAPEDEAETQSGKTLIIYGGRSAYLILVQRGAEEPRAHSLPFSKRSEQPVSEDDGSLIDSDTTARAPHDLDDKEVAACCHIDSDFSEAVGSTLQDTRSSTEDQAFGEPPREIEAELCGSRCDRGMQILATLMPGTEQKESDTGVVKSAPAWGILPHVRELHEVFSVLGWQAAYQRQSTAASIVFRARRRGRRHTRDRTDEQSDASSRDPAGLRINSFRAAEQPQSFHQTHVGSVWTEPPSHLHGYELEYPQVDICEPARETAAEALATPSEAMLPTPISNRPEAAAPASLGDQQRALHQRQISILLSQSHQATVGSSKHFSATGGAAGASFNAPGWPPEPLDASNSYATHSALPPAAPLCRATLNSSHSGSQRGIKASFPQTQSASEPSGNQPTRGEQDLPLSQRTAREARGAARHKLCRRASCASRQPLTRLASAPSSNGEGQQDFQGAIDGVDALMRWMNTPFEPTAGCSTGSQTAGWLTANRNEMNLCNPAKTRSSSSNNVSNENIGRLHSARAMLLESRCCLSSDDVVGADQPLDKRLSNRLLMAPWFDSSQYNSAPPPSTLHSSQPPGGVPKMKACADKKALPPLPLKLNLPLTRLAAPQAKALGAHYVGPLAFAAKASKGPAASDLPFPRPARKIKASDSKPSKRGSTRKAGGATRGGPPQKANRREATPSQLLPRQPHRLSKPSSAVSQSKWTKGTQPAAAAPSSGLLRVPNAKKGSSKEIAVGESRAWSARRKSSGRKASLPLLPRAAVEAYQPGQHVRLLRRMEGWPGEAVAAFLLANNEPSTKLRKASSSKPNWRGLNWR
ncbi:hypothetical protein Efla_005641 [Eimeria flavescens]